MKRIEIYIQSQLNEFKKRIPKIFNDIFFRDKVSHSILILNFLLFVIVWSFAFLNFQVSDYVVPVRYNSFIGVTDLDSWYGLYKIPFFYTIASLLNIVLSKVIYKKDKLVSYLLVGVNLFLSLIVIIGIINFSKIIEGIR